MYNLKNAISILTMFAYQPMVTEILSDLKQLQINPDFCIDQLRKKLKIIINDETNQLILHDKICFTDVAHKTLILLAQLRPLNTEDPISCEEIQSHNKIFLSNGYQYCLLSLFNYHEKRPFRLDSDYAFPVHKAVIDCLTNQPFHDLDINLIEQHLYVRSSKYALAKKIIKFMHKHSDAELSCYLFSSEIYKNSQEIARQVDRFGKYELEGNQFMPLFSSILNNINFILPPTKIDSIYNALMDAFKFFVIGYSACMIFCALLNNDIGELEFSEQLTLDLIMINFICAHVMACILRYMIDYNICKNESNNEHYLAINRLRRVNCHTMTDWLYRLSAYAPDHYNYLIDLISQEQPSFFLRSTKSITHIADILSPGVYFVICFIVCSKSLQQINNDTAISAINMICTLVLPLVFSKEFICVHNDINVPEHGDDNYINIDPRNMS